MSQDSVDMEIDSPISHATTFANKGISREYKNDHGSLRREIDKPTLPGSVEQMENHNYVGDNHGQNHRYNRNREKERRSQHNYRHDKRYHEDHRGSKGGHSQEDRYNKGQLESGSRKFRDYRKDCEARGSTGRRHKGSSSFDRDHALDDTYRYKGSKDDGYRKHTGFNDGDMLNYAKEDLFNGKRIRTETVDGFADIPCENRIKGKCFDESQNIPYENRNERGDFDGFDDYPYGKRIKMENFERLSHEKMTNRENLKDLEDFSPRTKIRRDTFDGCDSCEDFPHLNKIKREKSDGFEEFPDEKRTSRENPNGSEDFLHEKRTNREKFHGAQDLPHGKRIGRENSGRREDFTHEDKIRRENVDSREDFPHEKRIKSEDLDGWNDNGNVSQIGAQEDKNINYRDRKNLSNTDVWTNRNNFSVTSGDQIVWPPIVLIENLRTGYNKATKQWEGLPNEEVRSCLKSIKDLEYRRVVTQFDRFGHLGNALVYFDDNYIGYANAEALSQCLQQAGRGRDAWLKAGPGSNRNVWENWNTKELVDGDGKRIIYGYLVKPADLKYMKISRTNPKFFVQSYKEKVLEPMKQKQQENEKIGKDIDNLKEKEEEKTKALEAEEIGYTQVAEELKKKNEEVQKLKREEEDAEKEHRANMEKKSKEFDRKREIEEKNFQVRETLLRNTIFSRKNRFEEDIQKLLMEEQKIQEEEQKEKAEQKAKLEELKKRSMSRKIKLEKELQARMERRLADLEELKNKKILALKHKHHEAQLLLKEKWAKEKEDMLKKKDDEQKKLDKDIDNAGAASEKAAHASQTKLKATSCLICKKDFNEKVNRVYCEACSSMNVCIKCSDNHWKKKKQCFECKSKKKKPIPLPSRVYY